MNKTRLLTSLTMDDDDYDYDDDRTPPTMVLTELDVDSALMDCLEHAQAAASSSREDAEEADLERPQDYHQQQHFRTPNGSKHAINKKKISPSTTKRRRTTTLWFIPALIVLVGAATSGGFLTVGLWNAFQDQHRRFAFAAGATVVQLQRAWQDYVQAASWIHGRCRHARFHLTRVEFRELYEYLVAEEGLSFQAAQFVPNMTRYERNEQEELARAYYAEQYPHIDYRGLVGFESNHSTELQSRSEQDFYFPIHFMEPILGNEQAIDLDYYASGSRRQTVQACMDTGKPALTERLRLVQEFEEVAYGVVLMHPGVHVTTQRDVWPRDLASIVIRVNDLLLRSTKDQSSSLAVYLYDASDSGATPLFLGGIQVDGGGNKAQHERTFLPQMEWKDLQTSFDDNNNNKLYFQGNVPIANRVWTVGIQALDGAFEPDIFFIVLGGVLIFFTTLLLAIWVYVNARGIERANQRAERLLLNILPEEMATRLKTDPSHVADYFENATCLFADIVGFTKMSSEISPKEVVAFLNDVFSRFDTILDRYGLNKIKTIGDCYMVATVPQCLDPETNVRNVCNFALDMLDAIHARNAEFPESVPLDLRIGINCGPVVAGVVGHKRFLYDLWGDTVNIASRFESGGVPGRIQVTKRIMETLPKGGFEFEERGVIQVKGIGEMEAFFLNKSLTRSKQA